MTGGKRCGAALRKKPGQFCQSRYVYQNGRCRLHGGKAASGVASPVFRHGRHSKHFPAAWGDLDQHLADPDLRSMAMDLVVIDHRMGDILARVGLLKGDAAKARAIEEYAGLAETRSKLIDAEGRRMERGKSAIPEGQAKLLFRSLTLALREAALVADWTAGNPKAFLADVSQRFDRLMGRSRLQVLQGRAEPAGPPAGDEGLAES